MLGIINRVFTKLSPFGGRESKIKTMDRHVQNFFKPLIDESPLGHSPLDDPQIPPSSLDPLIEELKRLQAKLVRKDVQPYSPEYERQFNIIVNINRLGVKIETMLKQGVEPQQWHLSVAIAAGHLGLVNSMMLKSELKPRPVDYIHPMELHDWLMIGQLMDYETPLPRQFVRELKLSAPPNVKIKMITDLRMSRSSDNQTSKAASVKMRRLLWYPPVHEIPLPARPPPRSLQPTEGNPHAQLQSHAQLLPNRNRRLHQPSRQPQSHRHPVGFPEVLLVQHAVYRKSPKVPAGHALPKDIAATQWQSTQGDKIQWLGHSAFRYSISGTTIITDPLLTSRASPFQWAGPKRYVPSPITPQQAQADIILLTHNHYDHLDLETLKNLPNKQTVQVVTPLGVSPLVKEAGILNVTELDWNQSLTFNGLTITLVPSIHFSARWTNDRNRTLWGGYVIKGHGLNIWQSGDTTTHPEVFKQIGEKYGPFTHGLVSIGAYEPRSIMVGSHTTPEEAAEMGQQTQSKTLIAHHWGTIVLTPEPAFEAPTRFQTAATKLGYTPSSTWIMKIGETRPLTP